MNFSPRHEILKPLLFKNQESPSYSYFTWCESYKQSLQTISYIVESMNINAYSLEL